MKKSSQILLRIATFFAVFLSVLLLLYKFALGYEIPAVWIAASLIFTVFVLSLPALLERYLEKRRREQSEILEAQKKEAAKKKKKKKKR